MRAKSGGRVVGMAVKDMTTGDLEQFIEQKLVEFLGDPDEGLLVKDTFRRKLEQRLKNPQKRVSHQEVLREFGSCIYG